MLNKKSDDIYENYGVKHENINGKFEFIFGAIWTSVFTFIFINCLIFNSAFNAIPFFILFIGVGGYMTYIGAKKIKADKNTEAFGEECYGRVYEYAQIGEVNGNAMYDVRIIVYIPSEDAVKILNEAIGYDCDKFPKGSYLRVKYYENDVNIKEVVNENYISQNVIKKINEFRRKIETEEFEEYHSPNTNSNYDTKKDEEIQIRLNKAKAIIAIIVGAIWTVVTFVILMIFLIDSSDTTYFLNGEQVTKEEFDSSTRVTKIFLGLFMLPGIFYIITGVKHYFRANNSTLGGDIDDDYEIEEESDEFDPIQKR